MDVACSGATLQKVNITEPKLGVVGPPPAAAYDAITGLCAIGLVTVAAVTAAS